MNFSLSKPQKLIANSAREFLNKEAVDATRRAEENGQGYLPEIWNKMASLGWTGLLIPEKFGGGDGNFLELAIILEELGRALVQTPFIWTVISCLAISTYGNDEQKRKFLKQAAEGKLIFSCGSPLKDNDDNFKVLIASGSDRFTISGTVLFVPYASIADVLLIKGEGRDRKPAVILVNRNSPGIQCNLLKGIAPYPIYEVVLDGVEVARDHMLGKESDVLRLICDIDQWGALSQSAYICGLLKRVQEMTLSYAKIREQFDRLIGSFQAIQHQCADMETEISKIWLLTYHAAWKLASGMESGKEISMTKSRASDASRRLCLLAMKIHGGVGICKDHDLPLYFRMAKGAELAFGDGRYHKELLVQQFGL